MRPDKLGVLTNMEKDALIETLMWFWGNSHQKWRTAIEDEYGLDAALSIERKLMGDLGRSHARALKRVFKIGQGISELIKASVFAPENYLEGYVLEYSDENHAMYYNPSCSVQKARVLRGLSEYPCRDIGISYLGNFSKQIDPRITVQCIVAPPDPHPEDCYCRWMFTLNK
jgi:hypothetical protein